MILSSALYGEKLPDNFHINQNENILSIQAKNEAGLYNTVKIDTIYLDFYDDNFEETLTKNYQSKTRLHAKMNYHSLSYDSVGVRFRGQTSYMMAQNTKKKSFDIDLNYTKKEQQIFGYKNINLINSIEDPSFSRDHLYSQLAGSYIPTAKVNYIWLVVNGESRGLYLNIQQLDKTFLKDWFMSDSGTRWRAEAPDTSANSTLKPPPGAMHPIMGMPPNDMPPHPPHGMPPNGMPPQFPQGKPPRGFPQPRNQSDNSDNNISDSLPHFMPPHGDDGRQFGAGKSSLNYLGDSVLPYTAYYTLKSSDKKANWNALVNVCKLLKNCPDELLFDSLSRYFDLDRAIWQIATEIAFADDDGYVYKGGMDYYLYHEPETNRLTMLDYDNNSTFLTHKIAENIFKREKDTAWAVNYRVFNSLEMRQRYIAHLRTIANKSMNYVEVQEKLDSLELLIRPYLENDDCKVSDMTAYEESKEEIVTFIRNRKEYIFADKELQAEAPVIVLQQDDSQSSQIKATVTHRKGIEKVFLYFSSGYSGRFERIEMEKNGNDEALYSAELHLDKNAKVVRYYIEAIASNQYKTASYLPEGAEHEVFLYYAK
jgi:spore coat protein CotH